MASMVRPLRTAVTKASGVNALGEETWWRNNESCSFIDLFIAGVDLTRSFRPRTLYLIAHSVRATLKR